jgi:hypothetical protein
MTSLPRKAGGPLQFLSSSKAFFPTSACEDVECHLCSFDRGVAGMEGVIQ